MSQAAPLSLTAWLRYDAVRRLFPSGQHRVLEIGAGLGSVGALLAERFDYVGVEPDPVSFATARHRIGTRGQVLNCIVDELPRTEIFDIVCAFEVLEHIQDDHRTLAMWLRHLRPGGWFLASVPAGRDRFGLQDEYVGHFRRYDREDLTTLLTQVGLGDLVIVSYGFPLGNALEMTRSAIARHRATSAARDERTSASGRWLQPPEWAGVATRTLTYPFGLLQRPFASTQLGTGLVARAQKAA